MDNKLETRGRKTKCTDEVIEDLCDILEKQTLTMEDSCLLAGITFQTYRNWYLRGQEEDARITFEDDESPLESEEIYLKFYRSIQVAIPKRKENLLSGIREAGIGGKEYIETRQVIRKNSDGKNEVVEEIITKKVMPGQWQALAWMLERGHPDEFSKTIKHDWRKAVKESGDDPEQVLQDLTRAFLEASNDESAS